MAYHDTLFQLGMDLTRSSTAQKEDHGVPARVARTARPVHRTHEDERIEQMTAYDGARFAGQHLSIDVIDAKWLNDPKHIELALARCAEVAGCTVHAVHMHPLSPAGGVTGVALLSQGHISVQSSPESGYMALDIVTRGGFRADRIAEVMRSAFAAGDVIIRSLERGVPAAPADWRSVAGKVSARARKARAA